MLIRTFMVRRSIVAAMALASSVSCADVSPGEPSPEEGQRATESASVPSARQGRTKPQLKLASWSQSAKITASDAAAKAQFGRVVALSGDTAFIGAPFDDSGAATEGSVYVFTRVGTAWVEQQKLTASIPVPGDTFGWSVAIAGNTALVGTYRRYKPSGLRGSAYIFKKIGGVWVEQQRLMASDSVDFDNFGWSVAISGGTALVGAMDDEDDRGSAYVFTESGGVWTEQQKLTASDGKAGYYFGDSVALSGDTALVAADAADVGGSYAEGSVYVFTRSGGVWTEQQKLTASDGKSLDAFGRAIALSGDTALVGRCRGYDYPGAVYVFTRSAGVWTEQQKLKAKDGDDWDLFGCRIALSRDTALIGAPQKGTLHIASAQGAAYVFTRSLGVWTQQMKLQASDGGADDKFGMSLALSGYTMLVGACGVNPGAYCQGSVYAYMSRRTIGHMCSIGADCPSGFCVEGVCFDPHN